MNFKHIAQVVLGGATIAILWILSAKGQQTLNSVLSAIILISHYLGLTSDSVQTVMGRKRLAKTMGGVVGLLSLCFLCHCGTLVSNLPAVVQDTVQIASIAIADATKSPPDSPTQIVADIVAQTGIQDLTLIENILAGLASDSKTPAAAKSVLTSAASEAHAMAARKAASGESTREIVRRAIDRGTVRIEAKVIR